MKSHIDQLRELISRATLLAALVNVVTGCGLVEFDIDRQIPEQIVAGNPLGTVLPDLFGLPIPLDVDLEQETKARDAGPVGKVYLSFLELRITETKRSANDQDNFDFVDRIAIFVRSSKRGSNLPRVKVAEIDPVPQGASKLSFRPTGANIKPYVEQGAAIESSASGRSPPDDVSFDGKLTITVELL